MKRFTILPLFLVALCSIPVAAQDIILLNQDGEKVGVAKNKVDEDRAITVKVDADAKKGSASLENGIVTVIGPDGEMEQFELSDARSFTVTRSSKTVVDEDGNRKRESVNKAILIGPDGVRREINLGDGNGTGDKVAGAKKTRTWMIGASCQPATTVLRAQLRLDESMGLVITRVLRGSNAAEAGLQVNDILMYADQKPVGTRKQLSEVVNAAGSAGTDVAFTLLRGGEEVSVEVTPTEREIVNSIGPGMGGFGMDLPGFGADMDFEFRQFGPGIIIGRGAAGDAGADKFEEMHRKILEEQKERMQQFQEQIEEMRRQMREGR